MRLRQLSHLGSQLSQTLRLFAEWMIVLNLPVLFELCRLTNDFDCKKTLYYVFPPADSASHDLQNPHCVIHFAVARKAISLCLLKSLFGRS